MWPCQGADEGPGHGEVFCLFCLFPRNLPRNVRARSVLGLLEIMILAKPKPGLRDDHKNWQRRKLQAMRYVHPCHTIKTVTVRTM